MVVIGGVELVVMAVGGDPHEICHLLLVLDTVRAVRLDAVRAVRLDAVRAVMLRQNVQSYSESTDARRQPSQKDGDRDQAMHRRAHGQQCFRIPQGGQWNLGLLSWDLRLPGGDRPSPLRFGHTADKGFLGILKKPSRTGTFSCLRVSHSLRRHDAGAVGHVRRSDRLLV